MPSELACEREESHNYDMPILRSPFVEHPRPEVSACDVRGAHAMKIRVERPSVQGREGCATRHELLYKPISLRHFFGGRKVATFVEERAYKSCKVAPNKSCTDNTPHNCVTREAHA
jgi:hypothetical protein